jgi:tetratricopeptide (TPR) repeat protein
LSLVLLNSGRNQEAVKQAAACMAMADETGLRHLVPERLEIVLQLAATLPAGSYPAKTFDLGLSLLPKPLRVQVIGEQAADRSVANPAQAVALYRDALKLQPDDPNAQNGLILLLATCADASVRNGAEAVKVAEASAKTSHLQDPNSLELMACAYAEDGRWDDAIFYGNRALQFLKNEKNAEAVAKWQDKLQLFISHHPYHSS